MERKREIEKNERVGSQPLIAPTRLAAILPGAGKLVLTRLPLTEALACPTRRPARRGFPMGLPNVEPVYTWVRLAQRVPVMIVIDWVPSGVPLVSGMT